MAAFPRPQQERAGSGAGSESRAHTPTPGCPLLRPGCGYDPQGQGAQRVCPTRKQGGQMPHMEKAWWRAGSFLGHLGNCLAPESPNQGTGGQHEHDESCWAGLGRVQKSALGWAQGRLGWARGHTWQGRDSGFRQGVKPPMPLCLLQVNRDPDLGSASIQGSSLGPASLHIRWVNPPCLLLRGLG